MKVSSSLNCTFISHFSNVLPVSLHSNFFPDLENSDKLILPESVFYLIRKSHYPLPPVFVIRPYKNSRIFTTCGVFEFTAEEGTIYCPSWIIKKISKRFSKYCSTEACLEILSNKKKNSTVFPLLRKIEVYIDSDIPQDICKKSIMMYTVVNKGEDLNIFNKNQEIVKVHIANVLPKNKCLIKSDKFILNIVKKNNLTASENDEDDFEAKPMIESLQISLLSKSRETEKRNFETYTPWEHRVRPFKIEGENIDLLPWDKEEIVQNEVTTQTLPEIPIKLSRSPRPLQNKQRKILTLAFPQLSVPDKRPLTTLEVDVKYKLVSNSPVALRYHKNSAYN